MKRGSLKRMLEAAESRNIETTDQTKESKPSIDLFDLPAHLADDEIERVIENLEPPRIEVSSPADVVILIEETKRSMTLNRSQREAKPDDPASFLDSEVDLDEKIKIFHSVLLDPTLVAAFLQENGLSLFSDLLIHPNEDICLEAVKVLEEMTREEGVDSVDLMVAFKESSLGEGLTSLLPRIYRDAENTLTCLQLISNLCELCSGELSPVFQTSKFIHHLVDMIYEKAQLPEWLYNRSLASEILLDIIQSFVDVPALEASLDDRAIETILNLATLPQTHDDSLARELADNLMDCLISVVSSSVRFRTTLGSLGCIEKSLDLIVDQNTQLKALEVIEGTIRGSSENCEKLIKAGGLKHVGKTLMESVGDTTRSKTLELVLIIFNSLVRHSTHTSHSRVIGKMIENNFEKTRAVVETYLANYRHVRSLKVADDLSETDVYLLKCEAGLLLVQQSVVLVIRLFAEPNEVLRKRILNLLNDMRVDIQRFIRSVFEYLAMINNEDSNGDAETLREQLVVFQSQAL